MSDIAATMEEEEAIAKATEGMRALLRPFDPPTRWRMLARVTLAERNEADSLRMNEVPVVEPPVPTYTPKVRTK
jgi:hypothetical protein